MSSGKRGQLLVYELSCPICLNIFSNPLMLPCGHNYCQACISQTPGAVSSGSTDGTSPCCPECRKEFNGVNSLQRNFKLSSIIEGYLASTAQLDSQPDRVQNTTVLCDHCIDENSTAVKTCLKCEVSLCSRHLQRHNEKESFRFHNLTDPNNEPGLQDCTTHELPLEYFCSSDMTTLCATCFLEGSHQKHDVLTIDVAADEMREALESRNKVVSSRLQMMENLLKKTAEEQATTEAIGDKRVKQALTIMDSMSTLVDKYRERLHAVLEEERAACRKNWQLGLSALEDQQQQLLKAQGQAAEALAEKDSCLFIQRFLQIERQLRQAITSIMPSKTHSNASLNTKRLQDALNTEDFNSEMTLLLGSFQILLNPLELSFNLCTAHPNLMLLGDQRTVRYSVVKHQYGEHLERFTTAPQVLCSQGFSSGEHMWVVDVGANSMWSMGVCYKSIPRRGDHSRLGHNSVSWRLQWKNNKFTACHASTNVAIVETTGTQPSRMEVLLDYEGGTLSFFSSKGRRVHLHTFKTAFREPVYPAFSIHSNTPESWVTLHSGI